MAKRTTINVELNTKSGLNNNVAAYPQLRHRNAQYAQYYPSASSFRR